MTPAATFRAVCATLGAFFLLASLYEFARPVETEVPAPEAPMGSKPDKMLAAPSQPDETGKLEGFLARPLFSTDRRQESATPAPGPAATTAKLPRSLQLTGVVLDADRRIALIRSRSGMIERLAVGETIDGWQVESVTADGVDLVAEGETKLHLDLFPAIQGVVREGEAVTVSSGDRKLPDGIKVIPAGRGQVNSGDE